MNTLIVSTFDCSFEDFDKFVADFHEKEGHKYVEEYELIKVNEHKSHLIPVSYTHLTLPTTLVV